MKKILLVAVSVFSAISSYASEVKPKEASVEKSVQQKDSKNKPQLNISGAATVHSNFTSPDNTYYSGNPKNFQKANKDSSATRMCAGDANLAFEANGTLENEMKYGVTIDLDAMKDDTGVDKMYITLSRDNFGTIHMGNVKGPDAKCIYSGQQLIGGTTGVDGTVVHDIDYAAGVISPVYMIGYTSKATKISYYSPRIFGFQFATAITPDTKQHGHADKDWHAGSASNGNDDGMFIKGDGKQKPSGKNNIVFALTHFHDFENGLSTKLSGVYLFEDTKAVDVKSTSSGNRNALTDYDDVKIRNARSYHLSGSVGYKNFTVGAGFINNGKSRTPKLTDADIGNFLATKDSNAGRAWNIGAKYVLDDHWSFSTVFHKTQRRVAIGEKTKGNMMSFAVEYKVCDGLMLFTEFDHISTKSTDEACKRYNMVFKDDKDKNAIKKQKCQLVAIGAKVSF